MRAHIFVLFFILLSTTSACATGIPADTKFHPPQTEAEKAWPKEHGDLRSIVKTTSSQSPELIKATIDEAESYKKDFECAKKLQDALKRGDKSAVAALMDYPIMRERPFPAIKSEHDFVENWDDFFDAKTIPAIMGKEPEIMGWRGVMLGAGDIWFNEGKINGINMRTKTFERKFAEVRKKESVNLYPSVRGYKGIELECDTSDLHVRIQEHGDGLHYFSWKKGDSLSAKPVLSLKGEVDIQGSAGNRFYTFKNKKYLYEVDDSNVCEGVCAIHITVFKDGRKISDEVCK